MDELKRYIENHRSEFDRIELPNNMENRFEKRLKAIPKKKSAKIIRLQWISAAAIFTLFIITGLGLLTHQNPSFDETGTWACQEYAETNLYYQMQLQGALDELKQSLQNAPLKLKLEIERDTKKILAENKKFQEHEIPQMTCDSNGLYFIDIHYRAQIESINFMKEQLKNKQN